MVFNVNENLKMENVNSKRVKLFFIILETINDLILKTKIDCILNTAIVSYFPHGF